VHAAETRTNKKRKNCIRRVVTMPFIYHDQPIEKIRPEEEKPNS
jgi:hypothetical protein